MLKSYEWQVKPISAKEGGRPVNPSDHYAYEEEKKRLDYTLDYVKKSIIKAAKEKALLDEKVAKGIRHFDSSDSESYISLMVNTLLQDRMDLRLRNLASARKKPYFARVDFKENDGRLEKLYIGKMSLMRDEDQELIIVDWRAPVANLYYESRLGKTSYNCPDGNIEGELLLKRQFSIEEGILEKIFDIDITTNDQFLQTYLGANADNRLKEIVSTIQVEQNRVIRANMWTPLVVQGVAGSGKTTIALHRIAYLIYNFQDSFKPENFMILATNQLFLNYISDVLPELGVERVRQTTFENFALDWMEIKLKIRDPNEKLVRFVNRDSKADQKENKLIWKVSEFKSSMQFKKVLDEYISLIEKSLLPKEDFKIAATTVYTHEEICKLFMEEYRDLSFAKRIERIKKHLTNKLQRDRDVLIDRLQEDCDKQIERIKLLMDEGEDRRKLIIKIIDEKNEAVDYVKKHATTAVRNYIKSIPLRKPIEYYKAFFEDEALYQQLMGEMKDKDFKEFIRSYSLDILNSNYVELEDIAPLMYLNFYLYGVNEKIPVRHIVVDEAQDLSPFQYYVLKAIIKDSSFTLLGDLGQGIHSYRGTRDWKDIIEYVFDNKAQFLKLEQSYRTTVEIMEAAKKVLRRLGDEQVYLAKPVIRHGEDVKIIKKVSLSEIAHETDEKIDGFKKQGFKSIAVICKTLDECRKFYSHLKKNKEQCSIITGKEKEYKGGLVIVPSYLSKGLEFDVVIISNANEEKYQENELDIKLLYVAMTRPLHILNIYYEGELSPLLKD